MAQEQQICDLIQRNIQIVYDVCNPDDPTKHVSGERIGNPYILFNTKNGHVMVHIWQVDGVTTETRKVPGWTAYYLSDVEVLRENGNFEPNEPTFNPDNSRYNDTICRAR